MEPVRDINRLKKLLTHLIITTLICLLGLIIGQFTIDFLVSAVLHLISGSTHFEIDEQTINTVTSNFSFLMIIALLSWYMRLKEKSNLQALYFCKEKERPKMLVFGALSGVSLCFLAVLVAVFHKDLSFEFHEIDFGIIMLVLLSLIIQGCAEEMLFRGYLLNGILEMYSPRLAILASGMLFGIAHIFNPGITFLGGFNIIIAGIAFSYIAIKLNSLSFVIAMHIMWNFTQEVVFGLPNSGIHFSNSILYVADSRDTLFNNQIFGIEASLQMPVIWIAFMLIIMFFAKRDKISRLSQND